jgi:uncharacterized protein YdeI (YjbR/CyaY-like superfamily)
MSTRDPRVDAYIARSAPFARPILMTAVRRSRKALATFQGLSHTNRKDYVDWVTEARTAETRARRLATAVEWMAEGKARNWKYARK